MEIGKMTNLLLDQLKKEIWQEKLVEFMIKELGEGWEFRFE